MVTRLFWQELKGTPYRAATGWRRAQRKTVRRFTWRALLVYQSCDPVGDDRKGSEV